MPGRQCSPAFQYLLSFNLFKQMNNQQINCFLNVITWQTELSPCSMKNSSFSLIKGKLSIELPTAVIAYTFPPLTFSFSHLFPVQKLYHWKNIIFFHTVWHPHVYSASSCLKLPYSIKWKYSTHFQWSYIVSFATVRCTLECKEKR